MMRVFIATVVVCTGCLHASEACQVSAALEQDPYLREIRLMRCENMAAREAEEARWAAAERAATHRAATAPSSGRADVRVEQPGDAPTGRRLRCEMCSVNGSD
jgi:hypothetical protein